MKLDGSSDQAQLNSMLYHDNSALANIKHSRDQEGALEMVAGQFEAMFLQLVLRQMRSSSDVLADKDSPFSSKQQGVFRDMYDGQLAMELAKKQSSGIANMLIQQLSPSMREVASIRRAMCLLQMTVKRSILNRYHSLNSKKLPTHLTQRLKRSPQLNKCLEKPV